MNHYKINNNLATILAIAGLISFIANMMILEICKTITKENHDE